MAALCAIAFSAGIWVHALFESPEERMIDTAYQVIAGDALYNQLTPRELAYAAIRGMLGVTHDPWGELIEPQAAGNFSDTFQGQTGVVGLYAENHAGEVVITIVFPGGPAEAAGIQVGDILLEIDGIALDETSDSSETGLLIRGSAGTAVHLKTRRGDRVLDYDLVRQVRVFVTARMLPEGMAYLSLNAFNQTATRQVKEALVELLKDQPNGLILDLRSNEGGDMQAAQDVLSYFIEDGLLFTAELTRGRKVEFKARGGALAPDMPLVVLIDKTSYSAAETCAAAIAETGRGQTIGSRSYGKGVIQATTPLQADTLLQLTIAKWLTPGGEWVQERGVTPQIEATDDPATEADELVMKAVEVLGR